MMTDEPKPVVTRNDPRTHCIDCDRQYRFHEEYCSGCGFNPCDSAADEERQIDAEENWDLWGPNNDNS